MAFLGSWNSEVFAGITGLIGTVTGILVGQKAWARALQDPKVQAAFPRFSALLVLNPVPNLKLYSANWNAR